MRFCFRMLPNAVVTLTLISIGLAAGPAFGVDVHDTRLIADPAIGIDRIAFSYAGDLWTAGLDGGDVRRLTSDVGEETHACFSPDGRLIAFSGQYDGNTDIYVVPAEGGVPRRLTWHPSDDYAQGFTPDGLAVVFVSQRASMLAGQAHLYTVAVQGGMPERVVAPDAWISAFSPDGTKIAYVPLPEPFHEWKNYRGGRVARILIFDTSSHSAVQIPQPETRCNDTNPMWVDGRIFFRSDRAGEFNIFSWDPDAGVIEQITGHEDFPVLSAGAGGGGILYEQAGYLHRLDPQTRQSRRLTVGVAADLVETRPRYVEGSEHIRHAHLSPSGARAVFECRGEVITVPAEKGDPRNLTGTPGVHERWPAWSPDGKSIAYFSHAAGDYELHVVAQDGSGDVRRFRLDGAGFYDNPVWSPDSRRLAFSDNSWSLYWLDLQSGRVTRISTERLYGPVKTLAFSWAPDSRWIAYTRNTATYFQTLQLYSLEQDRSYELTEGLSDVGDPVFDASGKYLFVSASTDAGPLRHWFALSNTDVAITRSLYLIVLARDVPSPLAKESDEEKGREDEDTAQDSQKKPRQVPNDSSGKKESSKKESNKKETNVTIDIEGLSERVVALPLEAGGYFNLQTGEEGKLYYLKNDRQSGLWGHGGATSLCCFDLGEREEKVLLDDVSGFVVSADGKKLLLASQGSWLIADAGGEIDRGKGRLAIDRMRIHADPRAEWEQMFDEAWRINRDYFYDPNMHGADWPAMRDKYRVFLPHLATRADLNRVVMWMGSELAVGHHHVGGGDRRAQPDRVPGGLLGADFEVHDGRYRFARIYGGLNWNPELRSPLTEPGVAVQAGEYLLAVEGVDLRPPENLYRRFENTAGRILRMTVGPRADGRESRTVAVVPTEDESGLRNRAWVEGNLQRVAEATGGRVAYVYVPNTSGLGHAYFKRYFYPQADREAIIIDERHNGGGLVADSYIDILRRPYLCHWAMRYGEDLKTPLASIQGPKVMVIDEVAGSGGDMLPWMFRQLGLGTLVGKRTWGGLVGIMGFPGLLDGGFVTAPNLAIWTTDGWIIENEGVAPDIEVEQTPAEVIAGRDPQLEKAIEVVMEQLRASPPQEPTRPPYPVRVRR